MSPQSVAFVTLLSVAISLVSAQDIVFPGETDRPSRFPLTTPRPTTSFPSGSSSTQSSFVTSVTPPNTQVYNECVSNCRTTSEYNPVCGTDGVVYYNPGRLSCAQRCGNPVAQVKFGQCDTNSRG